MELKINPEGSENNLTSGKPDCPASVDRYSSKRLAMEMVASLATELVNSHPDDFSVDLEVGALRSSMRATTAFTVEGHELTLSVGITRSEGYDITHKVDIRPEDDSQTGIGTIYSYRYRLDVGVGKAALEEFKMALDDDLPPDASHERRDSMRQFREEWLGRFGTTQLGELARYADHWAESTINAESAIVLLQMATNLHRPKDYLGFTSGISLKKFREREMREDHNLLV